MRPWWTVAMAVLVTLAGGSAEAKAKDAKAGKAAKGPIEGSFTRVCSPTDAAALRLTVPLPADRRLEVVLWAGGLKALAPKASIPVSEKSNRDGVSSVCDMRDGRCSTVGGTLHVTEYGEGKRLRGRFDYTEKGARQSAAFELAFKEPRGTACAGK